MKTIKLITIIIICILLIALIGGSLFYINKQFGGLDKVVDNITNPQNNPSTPAVDDTARIDDKTSVDNPDNDNQKESEVTGIQLDKSLLVF